MNWPQLVDCASHYGLSADLYNALRVAQAQLGSKAMSEAPAGQDDPVEERERRQSGIRRSFHALLALNWPVLLFLWRRALIPTRAYMRYRYRPRNGFMLPLYYLIRWLELFREGVSELVLKRWPVNRPLRALGSWFHRPLLPSPPNE